MMDEIATDVHPSSRFFPGAAQLGAGDPLAGHRRALDRRVGGIEQQPGVEVAKSLALLAWKLASYG